MSPLESLLAEMRACRRCADLPLGPRPIVQAGSGARLLIVGQAPGTRVHASGMPFDDPSGDTLRGWLGLDRAAFYDPERIAILPAGLCYPGRGPSGDLPPRGVCAPLWHPRLRPLLPRLELTLLVGRHAQAFYLGTGGVADLVRRWRDLAPGFFPTPHPSPRNRNWLKLHPWFETEVVPVLRERVRELVA